MQGTSGPRGPAGTSGPKGPVGNSGPLGATGRRGNPVSDQLPFPGILFNFQELASILFLLCCVTKGVRIPMFWLDIYLCCFDRWCLACFVSTRVFS